MSAIITYTHDGDPKTIDLDFLNPMHVQVWVNGVLQPKIPLPDTKKLALPHVSIGSIISVQRYTPLSEILPRTQEKEKNFKADAQKFRGICYRFEEIEAQLREAPLITSYGINMRGASIKNCGLPQEESDATSMSWVKAYMSQKLDEAKCDLNAQHKQEREEDRNHLDAEMQNLQKIKQYIEGEHAAVDKLIDRLFTLGIETSSHAGAANLSRVEAQGLIGQLKEIFQEYSQNLTSTHTVARVDFEEHQKNLAVLSENRLENTEKRVIQALNQTVQDGETKLNAAAEIASQRVEKIGTNIEEKAEEAKTEIKKIFGEGKADIETATQTSKATLEEVSEKGKAEIRDVAQTSQKTLEDTRDASKSEIETLMQTSQDALKQTGHEGQEAIKVLKGEAETSIKNVGEQAVEGLNTKCSEVQNQIETLKQTSQKTLEDARDASKADIEVLTAGSKVTLEGSRDMGKTALETLTTESKTTLESTRDTSKAALETLTQMSQDALKQTGREEQETIKILKGEAETYIKNVGEQAVGNLNTKSSEVQNQIETLTTESKKILESVRDVSKADIETLTQASQEALKKTGEERGYQSTE